MSSQKESAEKAAPVELVTTATGRILRVTDLTEEETSQAASASAQPAAVTIDPARRTDVLFRVRRAEGHEVSSWWMIGAFVGTSALVIALLWWVPGGA
jgi:hypothetical protein